MLFKRNSFLKDVLYYIFSCTRVIFEMNLLFHVIFNVYFCKEQVKVFRNFKEQIKNRNKCKIMKERKKRRLLIHEIKYYTLIRAILLNSSLLSRLHGEENYSNRGSKLISYLSSCARFFHLRCVESSNNMNCKSIRYMLIIGYFPLPTLTATKRLNTAWTVD